MKSIIVCTSVSHGNTRRVADAISEVVGAKVVEPGEVDVSELNAYDLVGFGSGIFNMAFHRDLRAAVDSLALRKDGARAFVFATSGLPEPPFRRYTRSLGKQLADKGYDVAGTFTCRAFDTWAPFAPFGGIRKGHPDAADLDSARAFAATLLA